ncbi:MAG: hypothetical protein Q4F97_02345 [Bacteroidales bacterium]|nr:hypothetical protein [Bacteroidales bacterium]
MKLLKKGNVRIDNTKNAVLSHKYQFKKDVDFVVYAFITLLFFLLFSLNSYSQNLKGEGLKSAIVQYEMEAEGNTIPMTQYSDDYGNLLCMKMYIMGVEIATITTSDSVFIINFPQKNGIKYARPDSDVNYNALTPEIIKKYDIKADGTVEFLGKKCTVYTGRFENEGEKIETVTWVYKGVVLKSVSTTEDDKSVVLVAASIEENAEVSPDTFVIPADFEVKEMK